MSRIIIQNSLHQNKNREEVKIERSSKYLISLFLTSSLFLILIITLFILLVVYILVKSKHLIASVDQRLGWIMGAHYIFYFMISEINKSDCHIIDTLFHIFHNILLSVWTFHHQNNSNIGKFWWKKNWWLFKVYDLKKKSIIRQKIWNLH